MSKTPPSRAALRVADLSQNGDNRFEIVPDAAMLRGIAEELDLTSLRKMRFVGNVRAQGAADWLLTGELGATAIQPCAVTLAPVTTRVDVPVRRMYVRDMIDPGDETEVEMPEDDTVDPLGAWIDPESVMIEALSLSLPDYPRAPDAALGETVLTEPGKQAMTDEAARPFAGLAGLRDKLDGDDKT